NDWVQGPQEKLMECSVRIGAAEHREDSVLLGKVQVLHTAVHHMHNGKVFKDKRCKRARLGISGLDQEDRVTTGILAYCTGGVSRHGLGTESPEAALG